MILCFDQTKVRRSMTRGEWRELDRWRRITQRQCLASEARALDDFGALWSMSICDDPRAIAMLVRLADKIINPLLIVHPEVMP